MQKLHYTSRQNVFHLRQVNFLWQQMQYFVRMFEEYVMTEVIEAEFASLKTKLTEISLFDDLLSMHNRFLDAITDRCLLEGSTGRLLISLN